MTTGAALGRFESRFHEPSRLRVRRGGTEPRGIALARWARHGRSKHSREAARWRGGVQAGGESLVRQPDGREAVLSVRTIALGSLMTGGRRFVDDLPSEVIADEAELSKIASESPAAPPRAKPPLGVQ